MRTSTTSALLIAGLLCAACDDDSPQDTSDTQVTDATGEEDGDATAPPEDAEPEVVEPWVEAREACAQTDPQKRVFFGDLHVHTSLSFDAYIFDVRVTPEQAYDFARGEAVMLPPLDENGEGTTRLQLDRPLDFAAITDHSEYLAEVQGCTTPESPAYDTNTCAQYRLGDDAAVFGFGFRLTEPRTPRRFPDLCTSEFDCRGDYARNPWMQIQEAAEGAYDRTAACGFTSFVAYEWSGAPNLSNLHRNIIFRSEVVPELPKSFFEIPRPLGVWRDLDETCIEGLEGCDVLAIPHNSNWSNGTLFHVEYPGAETLDEEREQASLRARMEPIVEMYQHKGDSECMNGIASNMAAPDELCNFEKLPKLAVEFSDCGDTPGTGAMAGGGCTSRLDFVRGALKAGLDEQRRLGINPYQLGITASTDTHNGIPGATAEDNYQGHWGNNEDIPERRLTQGDLTPGGVYFSGGGLTAVWAEANSRGPLFDAMRRKETYGTSGTRIIVRFFGGWDYPDTLCDSASLVETGYAQGVPMGGTLPERTTDGPPHFVVSALQDAGSERLPGTPLQRIQIIKGWLDAEGQLHEQVYDVVGDPDNGASVDTTTCQTSGDGFESLCTVWTDPDFDPSEQAFYYARVVENPTCRWHTWQCNTFPSDSRPEVCDNPDIPLTVQERAWTSPIWHVVR